MNSCISIKPYKGKMIIYVLLQFVYSGLLLLSPYCYLLFLNEVITKGSMEILWLIVVFYVLIFAAKALVSVFIKQVYNQIFPMMTLEAKQLVLEKYTELDLGILSGYTAGELKERLHKDTENVVLYWEKKLEVWITLVSILVTTGILLYLNWILAVISFLILPLSFYITSVIKKKNNVQYERRREIMGKYNDFMIHNLFFWKEVKSNCLEEKQQEQFDNLWKQLGDAFLRSHIFWFLNRTFLAFKDVFLTKMGLYLLGGILVLKNMATVPALLAFMEYYADYVNRLLAVTDTIMKRGEQEESIKRIAELMKRKTPFRPHEIKSFECIEFRKVQFSYTEQEPVLQDFNMKIQVGERVAIVGESGCGKSTLIKMMAGYLEPQAGEVLWNGKQMDQIFRQDIYARTGFLMQESALFNLTIRENLLFGKEDAREEEMKDACRRANIMEFIEQLSQGFETVIGENGIRLSGGQRQRLLIARLFLQNPEVIVFDEATSALDYQNESEILNLLLQEDNMAKTFIMVTHRQTSVARCDRVVRM
ncbi:MAG TPA: ABC transporter ATP-binding protein [Lachnospiraceae bacterium]|nr:ABC transporter ATP-binding protein [Lachnospiraceae bacterium]